MQFWIGLTALALAGETAAFNVYGRSLYNESTSNHTCQLCTSPIGPRRRVSRNVFVKLIDVTYRRPDPVVLRGCAGQPYGLLLYGDIRRLSCTFRISRTARSSRLTNQAKLATQFWDTYTGLESEGQILPKGSWTLHGLWPDFCNGTHITTDMKTSLERYDN